MADSDTWPAVARNFTVDHLRGTETDQPKYLAVGTGTTAASDSDTALGTEVETPRVTMTLSRPTTGRLQATATKSFTTSNTISEAGVLTATSGGTLFFRSVFDPGDNVANGTAITYTWTLTLLAAA